MEENISPKQSVQTQTACEKLSLNRKIRVKKALPLKGFSHTYSKIVFDKLVRVGEGEKIAKISKYNQDEQVKSNKIEKNGRRNWKFLDKQNFSEHISRSEKTSVRNSINQIEFKMGEFFQLQPTKRKKSIKFNIPEESGRGPVSGMYPSLSSKKSMESITIEEARIIKMRQIPKQVEKHRQFPLKELDRYPLTFNYDGSEIHIAKRLAKRPAFFCRSMRIDANSLPRSTMLTRPQIKTIHMDSYNALKCIKKQIKCQFPPGKMDPDIDKGWILAEGVTMVKERDALLV